MLFSNWVPAPGIDWNSAAIRAAHVERSFGVLSPQEYILWGFIPENARHITPYQLWKTGRLPLPFVVRLLTN